MKSKLPKINTYQEKGNRSFQEDRLLGLCEEVNGVPFTLLAVADGMGGHSAGDVAAEIVIEGLEIFYNGIKNNIPKDLNKLKAKAVEAILKANYEIKKEAQSDKRKSSMGTTLVMALIIGDKAVFLNVGDSRGFLFDGNSIEQITKDHTAIQQAIDKGYDISSLSIGSNVLVNCLDGSEDVEVDVFPALDGFDVSEKGLMLCSDGISGFLNEDELLEVLNEPTLDYAQALVSKAYRAGSDDNLTAIVYENRNSDENSDNDSVSSPIPENNYHTAIKKESNFKALYLILITAILIATHVIAFTLARIGMVPANTLEITHNEIIVSADSTVYSNGISEKTGNVNDQEEAVMFGAFLQWNNSDKILAINTDGNFVIGDSRRNTDPSSYSISEGVELVELVEANDTGYSEIRINIGSMQNRIQELEQQLSSYAQFADISVANKKLDLVFRLKYDNVYYQNDQNNFFRLVGDISVIADSLSLENIEIISAEMDSLNSAEVIAIPLPFIYEVVSFMRAECSGETTLDHTVGSSDTVLKISRCTQTPQSQWMTRPGNNDSISPGDVFRILGSGNSDNNNRE